MAKHSIVVIEFDDDIQQLVTYTLVRAGYLVTYYPSGKAALVAINQRLPDLVVLDRMLLGMGGLEVCRILRADPRTAAVPIILLIAKEEEEEVAAGLEAVVHDYLTKPVNPKKLLACIRKALRRKPRAAD